MLNNDKNRKLLSFYLIYRFSEFFPKFSDFFAQFSDFFIFRVAALKAACTAKSRERLALITDRFLFIYFNSSPYHCSCYIIIVFFQCSHKLGCKHVMSLRRKDPFL